jgi:hypothetical protein
VLGGNTSLAGYVAPTGQVAYSVAANTAGPGSPIGSAALASGTTSIAVTTLPVGTDTVRAQYSGDSNWSAAVNGVVSSPGESHPEALSEPYLNLSAHTAPAMEPRRTPICQ